MAMSNLENQPLASQSHQIVGGLSEVSNLQRSFEWNNEMASTVSKSDAVKRYFDVPQVYLARSFNIRARAYIVRKLLGDLRGKSILDIGCGDGFISRQFLSDSNQLTLLDLSKNMLQVAQDKTPQEYRHTVRYINNDFIQCGFVDEFHVVLCLGVLAHVDSVPETIQAISTSLKKGGLCILQISDTDSTFSRVMKICRALKRVDFGYVMNDVTLGQIKTLAAQTGLQNLRQCRYYVMVPGMRRLPDSLLFRFQVATVENKWLSRFGLEVVFLLAKE
jgi:2-polyprenyl-3-methyl-5-hydroxy-6-metoxy-1,4-benzoquinol methylase